MQVINKRRKCRDVEVGKKHSISWYIVMIFITFGYVYEFSLSSFGFRAEMHSVRIASIAIVFLALFKAIQNKRKKFVGYPARKFKQYLIINVLIFFYMLVLAGLHGTWQGEHMMITLINVFLFGFIPIIAYYQVIDSLDDFMIILFWVTIIQTVIIWICILDPRIQIIIDLLFNQKFGGEDIDFLRDSYAGGLGCITSSGAIRYATGFVACAYFYFNRHSWKYLVLLLFIGLTCSMIARTGFLLFVIAVVFVLVYMITINKGLSVRNILALSLVAIVSFSFLSRSKNSMDFLSYRLRRLVAQQEELSTTSSIWDIEFFQGYLHSERNVLPPLSVETLIGTGVFSGTSGNGITVHVDGGFLKLYVAYGLILAVVFYLYFFTTFLMIARKTDNVALKYSLLLLISIIFIGEFKEFNIYGSCHVFIFFLMVLLSSHKIVQRNRQLLSQI